MINNWLLTGADVVPDQFTISDITGASLNTQYITTVTPVGYDGFAAWSIDSGTANTTGNTTLATSGLIGSGQSLFIRRTSSNNYSTTVDTVLTINGITDTWSIATRAADTVPSSFSFTNVTSAERSNTYSTSIVPSSYDFASWEVTSVGGSAQGSNNGTTWTSTGTIFSGETFYIRANSGATFGNVVTATANVGGVTGNFVVTVRDADTSPISNSDIYTGAAIFTQYTSNTLTITGLEANYPVNVSVSGSSTTTSTSFDAGTSSLSGSYSSSSRDITTSASGTFVVSLRGTTGSQLDTTYHSYLNVGSTNNAVTFTILTRQPDLTPNQFTFTDITNAAISTEYISGTQVISGLEPNYPITITSSGGTVDAGTSSLSGTFASSKTTTTSASGTLVVAAKVISSADYATSVNCVVTIGGVSDTFTVTTDVAAAVFTTPGTYSWTAPAGVTSVCVVCINSGQSSNDGIGSNREIPGQPGRGGSLSYGNNIAVTPGTVYTVVVGAPGLLTTGSSWFGSLEFLNGQYGSARTGGGNFGEGGVSNKGCGGGGGAGGYSGDGGLGGISGQINIDGTFGTRNGSPGAGGGGGGGGGGTIETGAWGDPSETAGGGGGGVGLFGIGSNGAGGSSLTGAGGGGGSSGTSGGNANVMTRIGGAGGAYGGGAGSSRFTAAGGSGAVRIIWGAGKSFPNNAT